MYLNQVIIVGNLTRDPELKSLPSGQKLCSFSLATNRFWKDRTTGERKESTDYHNIVAFGRQAETSAQYLKKGSTAMVQGRLQTRSWEGQDGNKRYRTEIVADRIQFGSSGGPSGGSQGGNNSSQNGGYDASETNKSQDTGIDYPSDDDINPEDIPF